KVLAGVLLIAGVGILTYALGESQVFAQQSNFNNLCCVGASRVPSLLPGVCGNTTGDLKNFDCGTALGTCAGSFTESAVPATCVTQGFKNCSANGTKASFGRRIGFQTCLQSAKITGCSCVVIVTGLQVINGIATCGSADSQCSL